MLRVDEVMFISHLNKNISVFFGGGSFSCVLSLEVY